MMTKSESKIVTAKQSKAASKIFNYGNIVSVLIPFPLFIFWFGASMFVYAFYRHHPNSRVGYYTQRAAYVYYGFAGLLIPVLTFAPGNFFFEYGWYVWGGSMIIVIPLSLREIFLVNQEEWHNVKIKVV